MKQFTVYKTATGEILRSGLCAANDLLSQARNNQESVLEAAGNFRLHYVVDGALVPLPPKPGDNFVFDYATKQWVQDQPAQETSVRAQRDQLLVQSDWTQMPDVQLPNKTEWAAYRQALRDITDQPGYPFSAVWPTPPQ